MGADKRQNSQGQQCLTEISQKNERDLPQMCETLSYNNTKMINSTHSDYLVNTKHVLAWFAGGLGMKICLRKGHGPIMYTPTTASECCLPW